MAASAFFLSLLFSAAAFALPANPGTAAVKIESYFREGSDSKLEGSGLLLATLDEFHRPSWYVLTSAHVVIRPSTLGAYPVQAHTVVTLAGGAQVLADVQNTDTERGVALLQLKNAPEGMNAADFILTWPQISDADAIPVTCFGSPAGVPDSRSLHAVLSGRLPKGSVLDSQEVLVAKGAPTEFGMSGGPVFSQDNHFVGLLTHITYEAQPQTFIIPAHFVFNWFSTIDRSNYHSDFQRTYEDSQYHFFSRLRSDRVHLSNSTIAVEKREDHFLVYLDTREHYYYYPTVRDTSSEHPGFNRLLDEMRNKSVRVAEVLPGNKNNATTTLDQFLAVFDQDRTPAFRDFEDGNVSGNTPSFGVFEGQKLRFRFSRVSVSWRQIPRAGDGPRDERKIVTKTSGTVEHTVKRNQNGQLVYEVSTGSGKNLTVDYSQQGDPNDSNWWHDTSQECKRWEDIQVPAGKFHTCRYDEQGRTVWYAKLPASSIVKLVEDPDEDGNSYQMELEKVTNAP